MIQTYENINISAEYQWFCSKPSEQSSFFLSWSKWVQGVLCYSWNLWKCKYLSGISTVLHQTFRASLIFLSQSKWVQGVVCYDWNFQKHKYLSGISMVLHQTFIPALIFPSQLKWVQRVVCYNRNFKKVNISAHCSAQNLQNRACLSESVEMSLRSGINGSAWNLQNRAHFSEQVEVSSKSGMLWSKLKKHKYLSTLFCRKTFRTGLIFLIQSKWVKGVNCWYSTEIFTFL